MTTPTDVTLSPGVIIEVLVGDTVVVLEKAGLAPQGLPGPPASTVAWTGSTWPDRPANMSTAVVFWIGGTTPPPGALNDDIWIRG